MISQAAAAVPAPTLLRDILTWGAIGLSLLTSVIALVLARRAGAAARAAARRKRETSEEASRFRSIAKELRQQGQVLDGLQERVVALEGALAQGGGPPARPSEEEGGLPGVENMTPPSGFVAGASGSEAPPSAPQAAAAASEPGTPVDFDGRAVRVSRALSHLGSLHAAADGRWLLYLNPDVEVNHVAYAEWSKIFELRGAAYARYRTLTPAAIDWNAAAGEGTMTERGVAEAIA